MFAVYWRLSCRVVYSLTFRAIVEHPGSDMHPGGEMFEQLRYERPYKRADQAAAIDVAEATDLRPCGGETA